MEKTNLTYTYLPMPPDLEKEIEMQNLREANKLKTEQLEQANKRIKILGEKIARLEKEKSDLQKKINRITSGSPTKCFPCCLC